MKKLFALLFVCFISSVSVQAQNADKAKALLNEVSKKAKSYTNIYIDFNLNTNGQDSKGNVIINREKYFFLV